MNDSVCLLGRDFPELGPLGAVGLLTGGGIALSRGALAKPYLHVDPNEDGALLVRTSQGVLLAVADGHNGVRASETALAATRTRASALVAASGEAFRTAVVELVDDVAQRLAGERRSRSCLVLARICGTDCEFASFGDSALFRATGAAPLTQENGFILGPKCNLRTAPAEQWYGAFQRAPGERVAVVTDGITNYVPEPADLQRILQEAPDDLAAARQLAERAMHGGAGDNVAASAFA